MDRPSYLQRHGRRFQRSLLTAPPRWFQHSLLPDPPSITSSSSPTLVLDNQVPDMRAPMPTRPPEEAACSTYSSQAASSPLTHQRRRHVPVGIHTTLSLAPSGPRNANALYERPAMVADSAHMASRVVKCALKDHATTLSPKIMKAAGGLHGSVAKMAD